MVNKKELSNSGKNNLTLGLAVVLAITTIFGGLAYLLSKTGNESVASWVLFLGLGLALFFGFVHGFVKGVSGSSGEQVEKT